MTPFDISPSRFRAKKLVRRLAVGLGRRIGPPSSPATGAIRVLTYHRFGHAPLDPCCLDPDAFDWQMAWLAAHANVLTPEDFDHVMSGRRPAPSNSILITIDDGHASVEEYALAALDRHGFKAVLFVCPSLCDDAAVADGVDSAFLGWSALARAVSSGHTIAPHGHTHRSLGRMPLADAIREIEAARTALADHLRISGTFFSFPFGTRADYSDALADALSERGFRYCFTSGHGRCIPQQRSVLLPRIKIEGGSELDMFPDMVRGCIDHWRFVDAACSLLQQRGRM